MKSAVQSRKLPTRHSGGDSHVREVDSSKGGQPRRWWTPLCVGSNARKPRPGRAKCSERSRVVFAEPTEGLTLDLAGRTTSLRCTRRRATRCARACAPSRRRSSAAGGSACAAMGRELDLAGRTTSLRCTRRRATRCARACAPSRRRSSAAGGSACACDGKGARPRRSDDESPVYASTRDALRSSVRSVTTPELGSGGLGVRLLWEGSARG